MWSQRIDLLVNFFHEIDRGRLNVSFVRIKCSGMAINRGLIEGDVSDRVCVESRYLCSFRTRKVGGFVCECLRDIFVKFNIKIFHMFL